MLRWMLCGALLLTFGAAASAQTLALEPAGDLRVTAEASANCIAGLTNDDGTFESSIKVSDDGAAADADVVMRFQDTAGREISQICVCLRRDPGASETLNHELLLYAADGSGGTPGTLVESADVQATLPVGQSFVNYDVTGLNWETPGTSFYAGIRWNSGTEGGSGYSLCTDLSGPGIFPTFFKLAEEDEWTNVNQVAEFSISAVGVRVDLVREGTEQECNVGTCVPGLNSLCLNDNRFRVSAFFDNPNSPEPLFAPAEGEEIRADSGIFTFFNVDNVELVVKALNGCGVNDRYWVFAAGLTNVEVVINVCDTESGEQNQYVNPQGVDFDPILDTDAFATCP
jgi:hypothetical protein